MADWGWQWCICCAASGLQLFAVVDTVWPQNVPQYHHLIPISYHLGATGLESTHVSSAIATTQNFTP